MPFYPDNHHTISIGGITYHPKTHVEIRDYVKSIFVDMILHRNTNHCRIDWLNKSIRIEDIWKESVDSIVEKLIA